MNPTASGFLTGVGFAMGCILSWEGIIVHGWRFLPLIPVFYFLGLMGLYFSPFRDKKVSGDKQQ
jgi:hypothetical protein